MSSGGRGAAVVLPVGGDSELLRDCLDCLRRQERLVDELIVVDDSPDGGLGDIEGAHVLRTHGRGPYAARNAGWRAAEADLILFLDVRSRPRPDWTARLAEPFADPGVALAGSDVHVLSGSSPAARVGGRHQFFELSKYTERAFFRPYFPTCNLAVRRADLAAVDGFQEIRSGGDADLCWRVLDRPGRRHAVIDDVLMDWAPRERLREYLEQNYRYGRAHHRLRREWAGAGAPAKAPMSHPLLMRRIAGNAARLTLARLLRNDERVVDLLRISGRLAHETGVRVACDLPARWPAVAVGSSRPPTVLFLDQGRATDAAAMGIHRRVHEAVRSGLSAGHREVHPVFQSVPPTPSLLRLVTRPVPGLGRANLWSVRFALLRSAMARRLIREHMRRIQIDVAHLTTDQIALLLGRLRRRIPCVLSLDSLYIDWNRMTNGVPAGAPTPWYLKPNAWLEQRALSRSPLVIAWTNTVARDVMAVAPGVRVRALHPGLDLEAFRPADRSDRSGRPRVLFVGGRWEAKGGPVLVDALAPRLGGTADLDVVTPAEDPERPGVQVHRASAGSPELLALFAKADVFCLPTSADACPWVVLEAMACGLPVVSTRVGSIPEMVGDGGVVVDPGDRDGLRSALFDLLDDPARRAEMGHAGRARVEATYDARVNGPALIDLLLAVAGREQA